VALVLSYLVPPALVVALAAIIVLPMLWRSKEDNTHLVCGANMKGLHTSMRIYASEYGSLPADPFRAMLATGELVPRQLLCPASGKSVADIQKDPYACFALVPYGVPQWDLGSLPSDTILLYERDNHGGQGGNVVYADGHVAFVRPYAEMLRQVEESKRRLKEVETEPRNP
jgi:prepilin-type processing-associated H-X9-DG protein